VPHEDGKERMNHIMCDRMQKYNIMHITSLPDTTSMFCTMAIFVNAGSKHYLIHNVNTFITPSSTRFYMPTNDGSLVITITLNRVGWYGLHSTGSE
jgi:hypothetical protein